jgi:CubicO group peptidase (beta-lactamase class C family)
MGTGTALLESRLRALAAEHRVTGASLAVVQGGELTLAAAGVRDVRSGEPVDARTVFDAASLTKPLVAYAALQLVDAGVLQLDEPLSRWTAPIVPGDPLASLITLRHVLAHTCGLQNLRGKEPLRMYFRPGERFSYSSIGFTHLQSALEARTGEPLEATLRRLVFEPLGMRSSSLVWHDRFAANVATPHDAGQPLDKHRPLAANASWSLQTTAADYAAFATAVLRAERLSPATWKQWVTPNVMVPLGAIVDLDSVAKPTGRDIGWGLGWGVERKAGTLFQWGKVSGVRAFAMLNPGRQVALVLLTNSNTGLRLMEGLTRDLLPGEHPAVRWLADGVTE